VTRRFGGLSVSLRQGVPEMIPARVRMALDDGNPLVTACL